MEEVIQPVFCNDSEDEEYGEHPEVIQLAEQNASSDAQDHEDNNEDINESEHEEERMLLYKQAESKHPN
ncbi:hypothetical protein G6F56_014015 [Rhizopus delemar]|nr:hypothetical protein G6F56_014015 [Rhizopus delemar]